MNTLISQTSNSSFGEIFMRSQIEPRIPSYLTLGKPSKRMMRDGPPYMYPIKKYPPNEIEKRSLYDIETVANANNHWKWNSEIYTLSEMIYYFYISDREYFRLNDILCKKWINQEIYISTENSNFLENHPLPKNNNCKCNNCLYDKGLIIKRLINLFSERKKKYKLMMNGYNKSYNNMILKRNRKILNEINKYINKDIVSYIVAPYLELTPIKIFY